MFGIKKKAEIKAKFKWRHSEDSGYCLLHYVYYETPEFFSPEEVPVISHEINFRSIDQIREFYDWLHTKDPEFQLGDGSYIVKTIETEGDHSGAFKLGYRSKTSNFNVLDNLESMLQNTKDELAAMEKWGR